MKIKDNTISLTEEEKEQVFSEKKIEIKASKTALETNFTIVKNNLFTDKSMHPSGRFLYMYLLSLAFRKGSCYATYDTLGVRLGWSRQTVWRILKNLQVSGWVTKKRRGAGKPNVYILEK